jgi:hypothetical protein
MRRGPADRGPAASGPLSRTQRQALDGANGRRVARARLWPLPGPVVGPCLPGVNCGPTAVPPYPFLAPVVLSRLAAGRQWPTRWA